VKKLLKDRSGEMYMILLLFMAVLGIVIVLVTEVMRVHSVASHVETEMSRAVNVAVEEAMKDSWRMDKYGELNTASARAMFYSYLHNDLGLTAGLEMPGVGGTVYRIRFSSVDVTAVPPQVEVKGTVYIRSLFSFILPETEIPFIAKSRNRRID